MASSRSRKTPPRHGTRRIQVYVGRGSGGFPARSGLFPPRLRGEGGEAASAEPDEGLSRSGPSPRPHLTSFEARQPLLLAAARRGDEGGSGSNFSVFALCTCGSAGTFSSTSAGQFAVDLDQRDRVAARRFTADVERRDVDAGVAERARRSCR